MTDPPTVPATATASATDPATDPRRRLRRRAVAGAVAALVLLVGGVGCLTQGVVTVSTTGGLLLTPVATTHLVGGWTAAGVAALTAAVLAAVDAGHTARTARRLGD